MGEQSAIFSARRVALNILPVSRARQRGLCTDEMCARKGLAPWMDVGECLPTLYL